MLEKEAAVVQLVDFTSGLTSACKDCQKVLAKGKIAVGVSIGNLRYLVGHNPPMSCCGEEKLVPQVFTDENEAGVLRQEVIDTFNRDGTTENVRLLALGVQQTSTLQ